MDIPVTMADDTFMWALLKGKITLHLHASPNLMLYKVLFIENTPVGLFSIPVLEEKSITTTFYAMNM
eukprot:Ihof_evm3s693 gene=Ihof_evmTU3s693